MSTPNIQILELLVWFEMNLKFQGFISPVQLHVKVGGVLLAVDGQQSFGRDGTSSRGASGFQISTVNWRCLDSVRESISC